MVIVTLFWFEFRKLNDAESPLQPEGDEYDPHLHRSVPHPTTWANYCSIVLNVFYFEFHFQYFASNTETLIHLLKGSLGTGILAMPKAFHQAGYLSGLVNTILIGILCTYGLHILVSVIRCTATKQYQCNCEFSMNFGFVGFQVRSQYILCKRRRVPILTYPISMKLALEEGPPALRWLAPAAV